MKKLIVAVVVALASFSAPVAERPASAATQIPIGTVVIGRDGHMYIYMGWPTGWVLIG